MGKGQKREAKQDGQLALAFADHGEAGGVKNLPEVFRRLYYFLYSNSNSSRAERILENLSLILLAKYSLDRNGSRAALERLMRGEGTASSLLMPEIARALPGFVISKGEFSLDDTALRDAFKMLAEVDLSVAPAHVLGEAFQALIGPRLRGDKGQFFTPRSLVRAMVQVVAPRPAESILDPACGTGGFLCETHAYQTTRWGHTAKLGPLIGIDKDPDLAAFASALVCVGTAGRGRVLCSNSLNVSEWSSTIEGEALFDVVLTNPPFGSRIAIEDSDLLGNYDLGHNWMQADSSQWRMSSSLRSCQDPQILFIELCVKRLRPGGRMGIVLPEGVFGNRQEGYVWDWLSDQGRIDALLDCPRTTFQPSTDTKTNVLFFTKRSAGGPRRSSRNVRVAVAMNCGHDRRGRTRLPDGRKYPDDFAEIGPAFHKPRKKESHWTVIDRLSRGYLVPRYYVRDHGRAPWESAILGGAKTATIGELVSAGLLTIRKGNEVGSDTYGSGDIPFVRTSDITNFEVSADPTKSVSEEVYERFRQQQRLEPGDVLMVVDGRYRIGATALLTENNCRCVVQSHFRIIGTPDRTDLGPYELLLALNLPSVRMRIRDLVFIQSTLGTLGKRLLELEIPILRGNGPWSQRLKQFENALRSRDRLLAEIRTMSGPDYDL